MTGRLKPMISLLLALLFCGASSQAAVCKLSCGLDAAAAPCRMAVASRQAAMHPMPHRHCSPAIRAARDAGDSAGFSGLRSSTCGHSFTPAVENPVAAKARFASSQGAFFRNHSSGRAIPQFAALARRHHPPRSSASCPPVVALRI